MKNEIKENSRAYIFNLIYHLFHKYKIVPFMNILLSKYRYCSFLRTTVKKNLQNIYPYHVLRNTVVSSWGMEKVFLISKTNLEDGSMFN